MCLKTLVAAALVLAYTPVARSVAAQGARCTAVPDLYTEWKMASVGAGKSDAELDAYLDTVRPGVEQLPDHFTRLWGMSDAELAAAKERRVWKDDSLQVIVAFGQDPELLVSPRRPTTFLRDAAPALRVHLARVAAAASDGMIVANGRRCDREGLTRVFVNAPTGLTIRQLHVHVLPVTPVVMRDTAAYWARVAQLLTASLGGAR